ncbi:unnamed protein product [Phytophthora lilii]|uniref:Unnamed protein product n=1 Tax=Phytophthora lilii TaxID=2077276 RepID=A0A9W6TEZ7_9STRA|nr:unnamed protein product [Phytophthora lilii]
MWPTPRMLIFGPKFGGGFSSAAPAETHRRDSPEAAAMNEEDEFGMDKMSRDADPMEQEPKSAVKDHPDFSFLDADEIRAAVTSEDKRAVPHWMTRMPVEKDPSQWTILEVQIRPDRSWEVIKELIATVCIGKGLVLDEEHANLVLFRKKVTQESVAHGMANTATFLNVYVRIGVSASKLRVVDICTLVSDENKLLGGMMSTGRSSLWTAEDHNQPHKYALDQLLGALQSTLLSQCLSLSHLYMSTPENSMDTGYVADLKRAFSRYGDVLLGFLCRNRFANVFAAAVFSEMKANMRDLCIPLESYAYDQEFACALLIGLLEPSLKKYGIKLTDAPTGGGDTEDDTGVTIANVETLTISEDKLALNEEKAPSLHEPEPADVSPSADEAASTEAGKIYGEVISELVQNLWRVCKEDCEVRLRAKIEEKQQQVTARVEAVQVQTTSFGIQVVSVELDSAKHAKGITIAMGLETEKNPTELKKILGSEEEETKEDDESPATESTSTPSSDEAPAAVNTTSD